MTPVPELMTVYQAAEFLGVSRQTIWNYRHHGMEGKTLRAIRRGRRIFFERKDVESMLEIVESIQQHEHAKSA